MPNRIHLSPPHMSGLEQLYINDAFASNWIAPLGPHVESFERELADYTGARGALALSSGTAAIHLALRLVGAGPGETVFCSTLTFIASANPISYLGAQPVFIDSEPESWNMSPQALRRAFLAAERENKMPRAVLVVNLYGQSADMDALLDICNHYKVPMIEDAAESLGATYKGRASGTFGKFGVYSFNGNKIITTSGGGALVSDDLAAIGKARFWAAQAREPARHYQHAEMGYNYRLSNILAGIGRGQLRVLEERVRARRRIFERYYNAFIATEGIDFMPELPQGLATRWLTALTIDPALCGLEAGALIDALAAERVEARPVWKPLHSQPIFRFCCYYPHTPGESVSDRLFERGICLPSGSALTEDEQNMIIDIVQSAVSKARAQSPGRPPGRAKAGGQGIA